ncbi:MAG: hypothetical protein J5598_03385 [Clostridia bacterium]|nr:hypothetical protein [Clostridia bacterium]
MSDSFGEKTFQEVFFELQYLNPQAIIKLHPYYQMDGRNAIQTNVSVDKLVLPNRFYYNEKNGITNKHNTKSGSYLSITVEPLKLQQFMQQPKTNIVDKIKQKLFTPKEPDREM